MQDDSKTKYLQGISFFKKLTTLGLVFFCTAAIAKSAALCPANGRHRGFYYLGCTKT